MVKADVSVVIPCYQCADTIERCVSSVVNQTLKPKTLILVDDASLDTTRQHLDLIKKTYEHALRIIICQHQINQGAAAARNAGWQVAQDKYVAFIDADDTWQTDKLKLQYRWMQAHDEATLSCHGMKQKTNAWQGELLTNEISPRALLFKNKVLTSTVMIKRDVLTRFDEGKRYAEDYALWLTLTFSGSRLHYLEADLAVSYKPAFGYSGLSKHLWSMQKAEMSNFLALYQQQKIPLPLFIGVVSFSLLKFIRRLFKTAIIKVAGGV